MDAILSIIALAIAVWFAAEDVIRPLFRSSSMPPRSRVAAPAAPAAPPPTRPNRRIGRVQKRVRRSTAGARVPARSPRPDALNARSSVQPVHGVDMPPRSTPTLDMTADELRNLAKALQLRARGATKQQALEQAFSVSKGGSKGWARASSLWDLGGIE